MMITKHSFWLAAAGSAMMLGGAMATSADAYTYSSLVGSVHADHGGNPDLPMMYRDIASNYSLTFTQNGTEYVLGAVLYNSIHAGNEPIPAIKDIASSPDSPAFLGTDEDSPAVGGLFLAEAAGITSPGPEGDDDPHQYFAPAASGNYSFTDHEGNAVNFAWNPDDANTLLQLFADDTGSFAANMQNGAQDAIDNMSASMLAEIGFEGNAVLGAQYDLLQEYYAVELGFNGTTFTGPERFVGNLNVLNDWEGLFPNVRDHDGGNEIHIFGSLSEGVSGGWEFTGDGSRISFIVPSPVAVGPGLALLGVIGLLRKPRREQDAMA